MGNWPWYEYVWRCTCGMSSSEPSHEHRVFPPQYCPHDGMEMRLVERNALMYVGANITAETYPA